MKVELIDHMGTDLSVVNAAKVSFHKESKWESTGNPLGAVGDEFDIDKRTLSDKDKRLIKYLATHNHWSPFAHCFLSFRIKAPIFVARQLGKHQVGLAWNEVSRRYVDDPPEFYEPEVWRKKAQNVKQGSSDEAVDPPPLWSFEDWTGDFQIYYADAFNYYNHLLDSGVCPEQARMVLPQSMYTEWYWSGSLMAFIRVCKLRLDPHTQKETREVAQLIADIVERLYPESFNAWKEVNHG